MTKVLIGVAGIVVMAVGGFLDPERRYLYLLFILLGLVGTFKAFLAWEGRRAERTGGSL